MCTFLLLVFACLHVLKSHLTKQFLDTFSSRLYSHITRWLLATLLSYYQMATAIMNNNSISVFLEPYKCLVSLFGTLFLIWNLEIPYLEP